MDEKDATTGPGDASNKAQSAPLGATNTGAAGIPAAPVSAPASVPASPPANSPVPNPTLSTDIEKILKEVKLPERRIAPGAAGQAGADVKPAKQIPISPALSDAPIGEHAPVATPGQAPEPAAGEKSVVALHTFRDDLKSVVRDQKISVIHAAALEEEKRGQRQTAPVQTPVTVRRTRGIVFAVAVLSFLGLAALVGVYIVMQNQSAPVPVQKNDSLVFAESSVAFPLDNASPNTLRDTLAQARAASSASLGSITRIVPLLATPSNDGTPAQPRIATLSEFLNALGAHPPAELLRALSGDFFLGIHTVDKNAPVFVIPVTSYDRAFAGMLAWEPAMNGDLSPLFTPLPILTTGADGIPVQRAFADVVMRNYDVRALKDDGGNIELYYSFPTRNILIIAESPYTFAEVLTRLQANRQLQ